MPKTCAVSKCDRTSRAVCDCCKADLCLQHLNEHNATLVEQINPLTDQINVLGDRLNMINLSKLGDNARQKLEEWRIDSHLKIDHFFKQKCEELDRLTSANICESREKIQQLQTKLGKLIHHQEATRQEIETLTSNIKLLEIEIDKTCRQRFQIVANPLRIDDKTIQFNVDDISERELDASSFSSVYQTILRPDGSYRALATNDRLLVVHLAPNLCFLNADLVIVRKLEWIYDKIDSICWCSTLNQFVAIANYNIFLVNENSVNIDTLDVAKKRKWRECTCFDNQLFLSTNVMGSSIVEVELAPSSTNVIREWKPPISCDKDEFIGGIDYTDGKLAIIITNTIDKSIRMELRSAKTMDRLWLLSLEVVPDTKSVLRCCSINGNGWLVADFISKRVLHITKDGKMKQAIAYKKKPFRVILFATDLVVVTTSSINFHKI